MIKIFQKALFFIVTLMGLSAPICAENAIELDLPGTRFIEALMANQRAFGEFSELADMVDSAKIVRLSDDVRRYELVGVELLGGDVVNSVITLKITEARTPDDMSGFRYDYKTTLEVKDRSALSED